MKTWYEILDDGTVGRNVCIQELAEELGLSLVTEREIVYGYDGKRYLSGDEPERPVTEADYDRVLEDHLKSEQIARGYTTRSPSEYANSTNARWAQDAADWVAHVTAAMEYGLGVMNAHARGEAVPSLEEFKAALPIIEWTCKEVSNV